MNHLLKMLLRVVWTDVLFCCRISVNIPRYGSYTLHGTGSGTGTRTGMVTIENNGSLFLPLSLCREHNTSYNIETHHSLSQYWYLPLFLSQSQSRAVWISHYVFMCSEVFVDAFKFLFIQKSIIGDLWSYVLRCHYDTENITIFSELHVKCKLPYQVLMWEILLHNEHCFECST